MARRMYLYETHLHTYPVSKCAKKSAEAEECLRFYKSLGYDGIFITNHFLDGNINISSDVPYQERIEFYFSDYENALKLSDEVGIKVFCGIESSYCGTDFLVYGLNKEWFLQHPECMEYKNKTDQLSLFAEHGALIIQAHPYREAAYINHIRLFPRHVHGVEVINASVGEFGNQMAAAYAEAYGLCVCAGSDNHKGAGVGKLAGVSTEQPLESTADFIAAVKERKLEIFTKDLT